jgi:hypothetical protein
MSIAVPITRTHAFFSSKDAAPLGRDPADHAILFADGPVFDVVERAPPRIAGGGKGGCRTLPVVRMQPVVEIRHRDRHIRRNAEHGLDAGRPEQKAGDHIDVPEADFRGLGGKAQLFLAVPQRLADGVLLGGVESLAEDAGGPAVVADQGCVVEGQVAGLYRAGGRAAIPDFRSDRFVKLAG